MKKAVALRKESVDRNLYYQDNRTAPRRVALRKESVDRNKDTCLSSRLMYQSLSARRAWIEILPCTHCSSRTVRRSPQGERG